MIKECIVREDAIKLLQIHERARQGRLRAKLMRDIRNSEKQSEQKKAVETVESECQIGLAAAAVRIQKLWRGFITRKFAQRKREEELIFIGMVSHREVVKKKKRKKYVMTFSRSF